MGLDELILVVPRGRLLPPGGLDGFFAGGVDASVERIRRQGEFRRRADVEEDPSLKQIIPYLIIRHRDRIFLFQRSTRGGEERLHGRYSIGVGGDIAREDTNGAQDLLAVGLERELHEELVIANGWRARPAGALNQDDTPVSPAHLGVGGAVGTDDAPPPNLRRTLECGKVSRWTVRGGAAVGVFRERVWMVQEEARSLRIAGDGPPAAFDALRRHLALDAPLRRIEDDLA